MPLGRLAAGLGAFLLIAACRTSTAVHSGDAAGAGAIATGSTPADSGPTTTTADPATTTPASDPTTTPSPATTTPDSSPSTTAADADRPTITWSQCGAGLDCGTLTAPLDYSNPATGTVKLNLLRALATKPSERIGSLLVNPGGPGFGGTYLAEGADSTFSASIREHFDVVAWDPRGTGASVPFVDCIDSYDQYFALDPTPDTPAEQQALEDAAKAFAGQCAAKGGELLAHISTVDSARDMDRIRQALGEDKISYFGFSYGSELGATWATMFPATVRAAVLDGAIDLLTTGIEGSIAQAKGFEIALDAFLADCQGKCAFAQGGDPGAAFDRILADIDTHDYPTVPGRPNLNQGIAYTGTVESLYSEFRWPELADALEKARNGDGSGFLTLFDDYYQRHPDGTYDNSLEAFLAISCLDNPGPKTVAEVDSYTGAFEAAAPRIGPSFTHGYSCVYWPVPRAPVVPFTGKGAGPIIVIGTTNDSATPFESSKQVADELEGGVFVKVVGNGHTGYAQSQCTQDLVDTYLVNLVAPTQDVDCE